MQTQRSETDTPKINKKAIFGKVLLTLAAGGVGFFAMALIDLLLRSEDIHMPVLCLVSYLLPASLLPVIWVKQRKKYAKGWLLAAAVCAVVLAGDFAAVKHDKSLRVDTARYMNLIETLTEYEPFEEDSRVVKVKSETVQLAGDLPVIDGAIAFHPLYSAFVHAVYPESEELYYGSFDHVRSWGYEEMAEKNTDLFLSLERPTKEQEAKAAAHGTTYEFTDIGSEAMVFIVHKDNPVDSLTAEQLRGIYAGEITNWKEVGGENRKIRAYQNEAGSGIQHRMEDFMGGKALMEPPTEMTYDELYAWAEEVSGYRNKAGSIGFAYRYCVKDEPDIKVLAVDGAAPTRENMKNGSYPATAPILAVTYEENTNENVDTLLDWILSEEGQYIIEETGYAGLK